MRHFETLLVALVGLAIVAALAWLTTRAIEPFLASEPVLKPTPTERARAMPAIVATVAARPTPTAAPKRPTATAVPERATPKPQRSPEPESRPSPMVPRPTPEPVRPPRPTPASAPRWSAPRDYRVEHAAKLHEEPDATSHVIARLRPGTIVRVVAEQSGWLRVESSLGRRAGWLEGARLRPVAERR